MRLLSLAYALIVFAAGASAREGEVDIRWTLPAPDASELVLSVRSADGTPLMSMREPVAEGATEASLRIPPLTRQASSVQAGLVEMGRVVAQSPLKPVSAREIEINLEMRSLLAVGFDDHWRCEESDATLRITRLEDTLHARHGQDSVKLDAEDAEDVYSGPDDSRIVLTGNQAEITLAGQEHGTCHPALFPPIIPMQIVALDASWSVAMGLDTALLDLPGLSEDSVAASGLHVRAQRDGNIRITGETLSITLTDELCRVLDGMLPWPFSARLQMGHGSDGAPGCAGNPLDLLSGAEWQVRSIYGQPLSPETPVLSLQISGSEISGRTPCNRYVGTAAIVDGQLSFRELGATRLACPAEQRNIEARFLDALEIATGFDLWRNGGLSLRAGSVAVLTAHRD